jgi:hypothetical protein
MQPTKKTGITSRGCLRFDAGESVVCLAKLVCELCCPWKCNLGAQVARLVEQAEAKRQQLEQVCQLGHPLILRAHS